MTIKQYNLDNTNTTKQFNNALSSVFGSIKQRNQQVQELLIIAVNEAAKLVGDLPSNNLDWLSNLLAMAEDTKGINVKKLSTYVKEVLCCNTVSWNKEKMRLKKVNDKTVKLTYNLTPDVSWIDYGKKETVAQAFDYTKRGVSAMVAARTKGTDTVSLSQLLSLYLASEDCPDSVQDLMTAISECNPLEKVA